MQPLSLFALSLHQSAVYCCSQTAVIGLQLLCPYKHFPVTSGLTSRACCLGLQVLLKSPMLLESELRAITSQPGALKAAVDALCRDVEEAVKSGCEVGTQ